MAMILDQLGRMSKKIEKQDEKIGRLNVNMREDAEMISRHSQDEALDAPHASSTVYLPKTTQNKFAHSQRTFDRGLETPAEPISPVSKRDNPADAYRSERLGIRSVRNEANLDALAKQPMSRREPMNPPAPTARRREEEFYEELGPREHAANEKYAMCPEQREEEAERPSCLLAFLPRQ